MPGGGTRRLLAGVVLAGATVGCLALPVVEPRSSVEAASGDAAIAADPLARFAFDGPDLHPALRASDLAVLRNIPDGVAGRPNPHRSSDPVFVEGVARGGSQGRLDADGIRAALYARYETDAHELGIYGLEAATDADADRREAQVRAIWAHNASFGRSRVHRSGRVLLVVWHDGLPSDVWEAANDALAARLD